MPVPLFLMLIFFMLFIDACDDAESSDNYYTEFRQMNHEGGEKVTNSDIIKAIRNLLHENDI